MWTWVGALQAHAIQALGGHARLHAGAMPLTLVQLHMGGQQQHKAFLMLHAATCAPDHHRPTSAGA